VSKKGLIIFAREPLPGKVKTRLAAAIGDIAAAELYRAMLLDVLELTRKLTDVETVVYWACEENSLLQLTESYGCCSRWQTSGDLGERMQAAFAEMFENGFENCCIIGSDIPDLPYAYITQAFDILANHPADAVFGPSSDGGYYLLGLKQMVPQLFSGIEWSTSLVLQQSLSAARQAGAATALLPPWHDIDAQEDLTAFLRRSVLNLEAGSRTATLANERMILSCQDITTHREAERAMRLAKETAEAANKTKSIFLTNMSHELRTPLSGVVGVTELLRKSSLDATQREYVGIIRTSSELLLGLINDLLTFARIEAGKLELHPHDFNLAYLVNDALAILTFQASEKNLNFECSIEPDVPPYLHGDSTRLSQIIINLASNAIKFTEKGSVCVGVQLLSQTGLNATLVFTVRDTGIGIPPDRLKAIFAPFVQVDGSTSRKYGGTGLGLSICQQLAALMGSAISVESVEGGGSTFRFEVELKKQAVSEIKPAFRDGENQQEAALIRRGDRGRILLAEDHSTNRRVIKMMILSLGYQVDAVCNGLLAVTALQSSHYDLVLMDCQMPEMNGYQATTAIRDPLSAVLNHNIPVVALTANAIEEARQQCLEVGMNDFLTKPVLVKELEDVLDKWLAAVPGELSPDLEPITVGTI